MTKYRCEISARVILDAKSEEEAKMKADMLDENDWNWDDIEVEEWD